MKRSRILILSVVLLLTVGLFGVQAFQGRPGPPPDAGPGFSRPDSPGPPSTMGDGPPGGPYGPMHRRGWRRGGGQGWMDLGRRLGLSDEQTAQMRKLYADYSDKTRKARATIWSLNDEKRTMLTSARIDLEKLAKMDEGILKAQTEMLREQLKMKRERLALLTEDQIRRLADFVSRGQYRSCLGGFRGWGGRGRGGNQF